MPITCQMPNGGMPNANKCPMSNISPLKLIPGVTANDHDEYRKKKTVWTMKMRGIILTLIFFCVAAGAFANNNAIHEIKNNHARWKSRMGSPEAKIIIPSKWAKQKLLHHNSTNLACNHDGMMSISTDGYNYDCLPFDYSGNERIGQYEERHNFLPKEDIFLLNQHIGMVRRICEGKINNDSENTSRQCLLPTGNQSNVNTPMPLHVKPWMNHSSFEGKSMLLYYSSHTSKTENDIGLLALDSPTRLWKEVDTTLSFKPRACKSLHSPSIFVDDHKERFYMYVHSHGCIQPKDGINFQPTSLYVSKDGVTWELSSSEMENPPYLLWNLFYLSTPMLNVRDGQYYALARTFGHDKNDSIGKVVLTRSSLPEGPFQEGPTLVQGPRHFDAFFANDQIFILFTMIGDSPEQILIGSIDTTSSANWHDWEFLPGPRILHPIYWYEHANKPMVSTQSGKANSRHELRDPHFLPDPDPDSSKISGLLFYCAQGQMGVAVARIFIDLVSYQNVISNRKHSNVPPEILTSTSLVQDDEGHMVDEYTNVTNLLVTGVGRTGTTGMCTLLRTLGIMVSHDNNEDCGHYPGPDGSISWYDAFKDLKTGRRYKYIIHLVRDPLKTINSRIAKCKADSAALIFLNDTTRPYEKISHDDTCSTFAIKNWVRRNSFVQRYATWRVQSESFFSDPLSVWEMCVAANFGPRCPNLPTIKEALKNLPLNINSYYAGATLSKNQKRQENRTFVQDKPLHSWESLANDIGKQNHAYIQIAQLMACEYGYNYTQNRSTPHNYDCKFTGIERGSNSNKNWDCFITDVQT